MSGESIGLKRCDRVGVERDGVTAGGCEGIPTAGDAVKPAVVVCGENSSRLGRSAGVTDISGTEGTPLRQNRGDKERPLSVCAITHRLSYRSAAVELSVAVIDLPQYRASSRRSSARGILPRVECRFYPRPGTEKTHVYQSQFQPPERRKRSVRVSQVPSRAAERYREIDALGEFLPTDALIDEVEAHTRFHFDDDQRFRIIRVGSDKVAITYLRGYMVPLPDKPRMERFVEMRFFHSES